MRLYNYQEHLGLKIIVWFITCMLIGALIALMTLDPQDEFIYRNRRTPTREIKRAEEENENDY